MGKKERNWDQENKSLQITQKKILIKLITSKNPQGSRLALNLKRLLILASLLAIQWKAFGSLG